MKRFVVPILAVVLSACVIMSCSRSTRTTAPGANLALDRISGTLVERNTDQMASDGPLVLLIAPRRGVIEHAIIPGSTRGDVSPADRAVFETALALRIGSYVVARGQRDANGDLQVRELTGF